MYQWEKFLIFYLYDHKGSINNNIDSAAIKMTEKVNACKAFIRNRQSDHLEVSIHTASCEDATFQKVIVTISYDSEEPIDFSEFDKRIF